MATNYFIRGNVIEFSTQFLDAYGVPVVPTSVDLKIRVASLVTPELIVIPMTESGGTWSASWDTAGTTPGIVYWAAIASTPDGADEGQFDLAANWANA